MKHLILSDKEAEKFVEPLAAYLPAEVVQSGGVREAADKMLESLDELASAEVVAVRAERLSGFQASLLRERVLYRDNLRVVISGLRFRKLNTAFPFVHLTANFCPSAEELIHLREKVAAEYSPLQLKGITIRQGPGAFAELAVQKWSHTVYGRTSGLEKSGLPAGFREEWAGPANFYKEYKAEYEKLLAEDAEKNSYLSLECEEDLKEAADNGLLMCIRDEAGWAGVIAVQTKKFYGFPCVYIFEIFLPGRLRGKRIAGPMQARFLTQLSGRFPFVFGHINDSNQSSLRTALSLGRKIVESEYFLPMKN